MATNAFYCPECGEYTRHVRISLREWTAIAGCHPILTGIEGIADGLGITKAISAVSGITSWKCCKCGLACSRKADGSIVVNNGHSK